VFVPPHICPLSWLTCLPMQTTRRLQESA
jgi:hypothetical protein